MIAVRQSIPAAALHVPMCACMPFCWMVHAYLKVNIYNYNIVKLRIIIHNEYNISWQFMCSFPYVLSTLFIIVTLLLHLYTLTFCVCVVIACKLQAQTQHAQFKHYQIQSLQFGTLLIM